MSESARSVSEPPQGQRVWEGRQLPRVGLSTASCYPLSTAATFEIAAELGYDGIEVMVWTDPVSQDASALRDLIQRWQLPVLSVHAPTLLLTQRVMGTDPWGKIDRSTALAQQVGAPTVVLHPPFRWQKEYATEFVRGVEARETATPDVRLAVENMFPWRARGREVQAYLPHWDLRENVYQHTTLDLSHTATSGSDAMDIARSLGERLTHIHLADGSGSIKDEHLVPGRGTQPCAELLEHLGASGFDGDVVVEVGTRRLRSDQRLVDLAESLAFARVHLELGRQEGSAQAENGDTVQVG